MPSSLGLEILRHLGEGKSMKEISKLTGSDPQAVGREIARLQLDGLISPEGLITEKGRQALQT